MHTHKTASSWLDIAGSDTRHVLYGVVDCFIFYYYFLQVFGPSAYLSRIYASWSRLSIISTLSMIVIFAIAYIQLQIQFGYLPLYFVVALALSRVVQCFFCDFYIALIEKIRWTGGWDGLSTSLYATQDSRGKEV